MSALHDEIGVSGLVDRGEVLDDVHRIAWGLFDSLAAAGRFKVRLLILKVDAAPLVAVFLTMLVGPRDALGTSHEWADGEPHEGLG